METWNIKTTPPAPPRQPPHFWFSGAKIKGSSVVSAGSSSEPLASWCRSSSVTKWLFLCAAALTDILHCTVYSPNSRKLPCRVQRPAGAGAGACCWLAVRTLGNSGSTAAASGSPRPATSGASPRSWEERTQWRWAACATRVLPFRLASQQHRGAGVERGRERSSGWDFPVGGLFPTDFASGSPLRPSF